MNWEQVLVQIALLGGTSGVTWFFSRRKFDAEVEANELDNFQKANKVWQDFIEDLRKELNEVRHENRQLKLAVKKLEKAINDVKKCPNSDACPIINKLGGMQDYKADPNEPVQQG